MYGNYTFHVQEMYMIRDKIGIQVPASHTIVYTFNLISLQDFISNQLKQLL